MAALVDSAGVIATSLCNHDRKTVVETGHHPLRWALKWKRPPTRRPRVRRPAPRLCKPSWHNDSGEFVIPGFVKMSVVNKPATEARSGINPFKKEPMEFAAKPASKTVKASPLKVAKDAV